MKNIILFTLLLFPLLGFSQNTITDIDGNTYNTVTIGSQIWMKENLKVSKYNNGDPIKQNFTELQWITDTIGMCSDNGPSYLNTFGKVYNWFAITDTRKVCPIGYHIPSKNEWKVLIKYLDPLSDTVGDPSEGNALFGNNKAGKKIRSKTLWEIPHNDDDSSGFRALPAGEKTNGGPSFFWGINRFAYFGVSNDAQKELPYLGNPSLSDFPGAWCAMLQGYFNAPDGIVGDDVLHISNNTVQKNTGISVRCISDSQIVSSLNKTESNNIKIYPNPTIDKIYVDSKKNHKVKIYDLFNNEIYSTNTVLNTPIDLSHIKSGIYLLYLFNDVKLIKYQKIVKM